MRTNRKWVLLFAAVVFIIVASFWQRPIQHTIISTPAPPPPVQPGSMPASNANVAVENLPGILPPTNARSSKPDDHSRLPEIFLKYNETHNIPIKFYGQVIDQDSNPVANVKIKVVIQQTYMKSPTELSFASKIVPVETESGTDGRFVIQGEKGDGFEIESIQKDGYKPSPQTRKTYVYENVSVPFHPDPNNPVIVKMWKTGEVQSLIFHHLSRIGIPVDGQTVQFDLVTGKKVSSGGQLIVRLKRDPQILPPHYGRYDWSMELEIPNGGLVTNTDEFMYQASESGYQKIFKFDMPKDAENWTTAIDQQFYIQLENEKAFGSLAVRLSTIHDTPPLGINLDVVINPSGSRSLQP